MFKSHARLIEACTFDEPRADMLNYRRQQTETDKGGLSKCLTGFDCVWLGVV